jgi:hypothetical protein
VSRTDLGWDRHPELELATDLYLATHSRLFKVEAAVERIRISRRRSKPRTDDVVDDVPARPAVSTDDAAELITLIDLLLQQYQNDGVHPG